MTRVAMYPMDRKTLLHQVWLAFLLAALAMLLFAPRAHAASNGTPGDPQIMPMPRYVDRSLVLAYSSDPGEQLILSDLNGREAKVIPTDSYALNPMVSPRGGVAVFWMLKRQASTSAHVSGGGPTGDIIGLWSLNMETGVVADEPVFTGGPDGLGGIADYVWGPDGRFLYVSTVGVIPYIWEVDTWRKSDPMAIASGSDPFVYEDQLFYITHTYQGSYTVTGSTVHIRNLDDFQEQTKDFPGTDVTRVQTDGRYLYYSAVSGPSMPTAAIWKWKIGEAGTGTKLTTLQSWYFNLAPDGQVYAASAFLAPPNWNLAIYKINTRSGVATYLTDGLYPSVGPFRATPTRLWPGFTAE